MKTKDTSVWAEVSRIRATALIGCSASAKYQPGDPDEGRAEQRGPCDRRDQSRSLAEPGELTPRRSAPVELPPSHGKQNSETTPRAEQEQHRNPAQAARHLRQENKESEGRRSERNPGND